MPWLAYVGGAVAAAVVGVGVYCNLPSRLLLPAAAAELKYLTSTKLKTIPDGVRIVEREWSRDYGRSPARVTIVQGGEKTVAEKEAKLLSSMKQELNKAKVPLVAVVHEVVGREVEEFRKFFDGDIFLDEKRVFYGPRERWMGIGLGVLRLGVWQNIRRAKRQNIPGNLVGEGRLLGAVYVLGKGDQGVLLEHREKEWGDKVDIDDVRKAVSKI